MSVVILNPSFDAPIMHRKVELVKLNGKYFIELDQFDEIDSLAELTLSLSAENETLRERILLLEEKLKIFEQSA